LFVDDGEGFTDYFKVAGFGFEPCDAIEYAMLETA